MKHYVQYHNTEKQGPLDSSGTGPMTIVSSKSIGHLLDQRVWLISGEGTPRTYQLEYTFVVDEVLAGAPSVASGLRGTRFRPAVRLSGEAWFESFLLAQQNFSLGVREIQPEAIAGLLDIERQFDAVHARHADADAALEAAEHLRPEDYFAALHSIEAQIGPARRAMLIGHAVAPGATLSMGALAALGGGIGHRFANLHYGRIGRMVADQLAIAGFSQQTQVLATAHAWSNRVGHWQWTMRPQLREALWQLWPDELVRATAGGALAAADVDADPTSREVSRTERTALIQARLGQGAYRSALMAIWEGRCALTGCDLEPVLVASHAKPWKDSSNAERLDPFNGLLLVASMDRLFDGGFISFDDDGGLLPSPSITDAQFAALGVDRHARLSSLQSRHRPYLAYHRWRHGYDIAQRES